MQDTPDPRYWWHLVFINPITGQMAWMYITEADVVEAAVLRARLAGAQPPGHALSAARFQATYVHKDFLDVPMTPEDFEAMPMPQGFIPA